MLSNWMFKRIDNNGWTVQLAKTVYPLIHKSRQPHYKLNKGVRLINELTKKIRPMTGLCNKQLVLKVD